MKSPVNVSPPVLSISAQMTLPENAAFPPSPSFNILPVVMADAVANKTSPVVMVSEVTLATLPDVVSMPNAWKDAEEVAEPPTATSKVTEKGARTPAFICHLEPPLPPEQLPDVSQ